MEPIRDHCTVCQEACSIDRQCESEPIRALVCCAQDGSNTGIDLTGISAMGVKKGITDK